MQRKQIECLLKIQAAGKEQLRNSQFIFDLICEYGLAWDPRPIFGPYEQFMNARGEVGLWQNPREFADTLVALSYFDIRSCCEIGSYNGGSSSVMAAYLTKFNPSFFMISFDINKVPDHQTLRIFLPNLVFVTATSRQIVGSSFDLAFIDGDHGYSAIKEDYANIGRLSRTVMFHDIVDRNVRQAAEGGGVPAFWNEIKGSRPAIEFLDDRHPDHFGIGILR